MTSLKRIPDTRLSSVHLSTGHNEYADWWIRWRIHLDIAHLHRFCACGAITMENLTAFDLQANNGGRRYLLAQLFRRRAAGEI